MKPTTTPKTIQQYDNQMDTLLEIVEVALKASIIHGLQGNRNPHIRGDEPNPSLHQALMEAQRAIEVAASIVSSAACEVNAKKTKDRLKKYSYHRDAYRVSISGLPDAAERAAEIRKKGYEALKYQQELDARKLNTKPDPAFDPDAAQARKEKRMADAKAHMEWDAQRKKEHQEFLAECEAIKAAHLAASLPKVEFKPYVSAMDQVDFVPGAYETDEVPY